MKVIGLKAENIKRLTLVNLDLQGDHLIVSGPPGRGKTTLVELVWAALEKRSLGPRPVQQGQEKGYIEVRLGDPGRDRVITVRREYDAEGGDKLKVSASDKSKVGITDIQKLIQSISFDPLEFYSKKGMDQVTMLLRLLGVDLGDIEARRKGLYEERTVAGRIARSHREALPVEPRRIERVSVVDLSNKLQELETYNRDVADRLKLLAEVKADRQAQADKIAALERQLEQERTFLSQIDARLAKGEAICATLAAKDTAPIKAAIAEAETTNAAAAAHERWVEDSQKAAVYDERYKELDEKVKAIDEEKEGMLAGAKWPLPGLSVDGEVVMYNGVPLVQTGEGKKLEVSFAIAAAMSPELRICRIDGAESLGAGGRAEILRIAKEKDMQVFMARVNDGDAELGEITIEEGRAVK